MSVSTDTLAQTGGLDDICTYPGCNQFARYYFRCTHEGCNVVVDENGQRHVNLARYMLCLQHRNKCPEGSDHTGSENPMTKSFADDMVTHFDGGGMGYQDMVVTLFDRDRDFSTWESFERELEMSRICLNKAVVDSDCVAVVDEALNTGFDEYDNPEEVSLYNELMSIDGSNHQGIALLQQEVRVFVLLTERDWFFIHEVLYYLLHFAKRRRESSVEEWNRGAALFNNLARRSPFRYVGNLNLEIPIVKPTDATTSENHI